MIRDVCPFLGLEYSPEMLRYHERADDLLDGLRATRHVQGVRRPPTQGLRDWRTALDPHQVQLFEALAGDLLDRLGYDRSGLAIPNRVRLEARAIRVAHQLDRRTLTFRTQRRAQAAAPAGAGGRDGLTMRITFLGHAGLFIETEHGSILCDPWFHPAFFASWVPFPDNGTLDLAPFSNPDYLYVSHSHDDHLDARFLSEHVSKDTVVILPDYPTDDHHRTLAALGFHEFLQTRNDEVVDLGGLRLLTNALIAPTDGAIGDSGLAVGGRDGDAVQPERLEADRLRRVDRVRALRRPLRAVLRRDLVPDGLPAATRGEAGDGPAQAGEPARARPAW